MEGDFYYLFVCLFSQTECGYIIHAGLELSSLLSRPPECWELDIQYSSSLMVFWKSALSELINHKGNFILSFWLLPCISILKTGEDYITGIEKK